MIAEGTFAPDVIEHIPGVANVLPDALSRLDDPAYHNKFRLPTVLRSVRRRVLSHRGPGFWRTLEAPTGKAKLVVECG